MLHHVLLRPFAVATTAACLASLLLASPLLAQAPTPWTAEYAMTFKRVSAVTPSPDGTKVAFVVGDAVMEGEKSEWLSQVHVANADGSQARQLTRGEKSASAPQWSPDGRWIGFISARGGKPNVWRIRVDGGEAEPVTQEKGGVESFAWSPDGATVAFVMSDPLTEDEEKANKEKRDWRTIDQNVKMSRLYVLPVEAPAGQARTARKLTTASYTVMTFDWSPDGASIVFAHQPTPGADDWTRSDIAIVSVADGTVRPLAATRAAESDPHYSPDGRQIAFVKSDEPPSWAFNSTVQVVAATGGSPRALASTPDGQPGLVGWTRDGSRVLVGEPFRTTPALFSLLLDGGTPTRLGSAQVHASGATLNRTGTHIGFVSQDFDRPPEAFIARADGQGATQVSRVQPALASPPGRSEVVTWKSKDGLDVEGVLTYPVGYAAGSKVPLLLVIHGGPTGVFLNSFIGTAGPYPIAAFAARGYAVLRVNPRGSSGYGKTFRFANYSDWGGADYQDLMTGVDRVIAMGVADPDRLGVMGWSYGGFMTSWIVTQTKRFKAASAGAPVTNLISFTGTADIPGFIPDYFKGEFWDTFDAWRAHSPTLNAKGATTPTLIQHGEADIRVPTSQGYEFYNALKRQGVTTTLTVYPRQPHGFTEPKMTLDAARANLAWFDRFVLGKATATSAGDGGR